MENKNKWSETVMVIGGYIKTKLGRIFLDAFCICFFALVFKLSGVSWNIVFYPALVCFLVWGVYISYDYFKFREKHEMLQKYKSNIDIYINKVQNSNTLLEVDYEELLESLNSILSAKIIELNSNKRETLDFVTLWSHEIKTPMTAINLLIQQISEDYSETRTIKEIEGKPNFSSIKEMKEKLFEMEQYVDMILQYVKLESISSDLVLTNHRIYNIVKESVKYFSKIFISKKITLNLDEFDNMVITDEKWVLFAIKQVLSNALKYTEQGSISIYMKGKNSNVLVIEDTGMGIGKEDLPRIFERGFTGYNGHLYKKSTGIGLYLTKEILKKLNHRISISSTMGIGTRVEIYFSNGTRDRM